MTILILQGPNVNLLGLKSSKKEHKLTLDKLNRTIRRYVRNKNIKLKIIQTHKEHIAINFLQRNRNIAKGLIIIPTSWAKYNQTILETISLINLPTASIYFNEPFSFGTSEEDSILVDNIIRPFSGNPIETIISAIDYLTNTTQ
jgi:3-dehydroquinate dehydratase-2